MFMARHKPAGRKAPDSRTSRLRTLKRRFDFHLGEAIRAALEGSHDKAATHSSTALSISRELCGGSGDPLRHRAELAAALSNHARYGSTPVQAIALLTESAGHYAALAKTDPAGYEVRRIEVLTRVALASDAAGNTGDAISLLREVVRMYLEAPAADPAERDLCLARARFHLGRCLLKTGEAADGLAETDVGLALAEHALDQLSLSLIGPGWLGTAPWYVQFAAPDWTAAAARSMTLHSAAGRWERAATAALAAVRLSGGLAGIGGDTLHDAHLAIRAQADAIWARVGGPKRAALDAYCPLPDPSPSTAPCPPDCPSDCPSGGSLARPSPSTAACPSALAPACPLECCSASINRFLECSTSASAAARSAQRAPSTDLPGSRSL